MAIRDCSADRIDFVMDVQARAPKVGPELVIGLVTPIGTNTAKVADELRTSLSKRDYRSHIVKVSDFFNKKSPPPQDEYEDERVRRLINAGDAWCKTHQDAAAVARIAILEIRSTRMAVHRLNGATESPDELFGRHIERRAYILHSLKRPDEVALLRRVYGQQFVLLGCQAEHDRRIEHLLQRPLSATGIEDRTEVARELIRLDAAEDDEMGQKVNETFPQSDYFLQADELPDRFVSLLFGDPTIPPNVGEVAMFLAQTTSLQSLSTSRRVGAALLAGQSVIAVGFNEVPRDEVPDISTGEDPSERFKISLLKDTMERLAKGGFVSSPIQLDEDGIRKIKTALQDSQLMSVIEYQRPIHAEVAAISDAARRGQPIEGANLYVTTYPCHLCFKAALAVGIEKVYYVEPYPKSRAEAMFPKSRHRLSPYTGVAPRMYVRVFERPLRSADELGKYHLPEAKETTPTIPQPMKRDEISSKETTALAELKL